MRQIYARKFTDVFATGDTGYVYSEKIDPGMVLRVEIAFAYAPDRKASDNIILGIVDGVEKVILRAAAPLEAQKGLANDNPFHMGEGDRLYAYFPDVDDTDTIELHVIGTLMPLDEWRQMRE